MAGPSISFISPLSRIGSAITSLRIINDAAEKTALMETLKRPKGVVVLAFLNQHALNLAWDRAAFAENLLSADLLLRDGVGVKTAMRALGRPHGLNMNGTDFIPEILEAYRGRTIAVLGSSQPWLDAACEIISKKYGLNVVLRREGFQSGDMYLEMIKEVQADLVLLAMGMPKQEQVARLMRQNGGDRLIICGGAIVDFIGGRVTRAPKIVQRVGLEWAYRLAQEPGRLWSRYGPGGVAFASRILMLKRRWKRSGY
jgi:N-acetylglucosaminyldiphosphoundecaprenol N-acetyl-beta-D-mannosaminyltransferase